MLLLEEVGYIIDGKDGKGKKVSELVGDHVILANFQEN
jgi:hypothetical protein